MMMSVALILMMADRIYGHGEPPGIGHILFYWLPHQHSSPANTWLSSTTNQNQMIWPVPSHFVLLPGCWQHGDRFHSRRFQLVQAIPSEYAVDGVEIVREINADNDPAADHKTSSPPCALRRSAKLA
jgi:hypothetical protein